VIVFEDRALADMERILQFNAERDPATAIEHLHRIRDGVLILGDHPEIGRAVAGSPLRELVISHGSSGYIALYEYARVQNEVRVVAIRHQRESGYRGMP
jgi:plasmid stabilization system protein ParE